ncbi:hypothetical protein BGZ63DRAFT_424473 [Mariannaea sp. PMI_226]|nr:hypothetical protein BGZ63DRAFT_424473 [Mariannaea sp. PMI_226]
MVVVNKVPAETFLVPPTTHSPNSHIPVIVYRNALVDRSFEGALEAVEQSEWVMGGHWKIAGVTAAATPHFHAVAHECYTVLHGSGTYLLGKSPLDPSVDEQGNPVGVSFTAHAGDVFTFPAGVTHFVTSTDDDYEIIGFYSLTNLNSREEPWDMQLALGTEEETNEMREKCRQVPTPVHDPIYGKDGPMPSIWKQ